MAIGMALSSLPMAQAEVIAEERPPYNPPKKAQHNSMPMINNPARHGRPMNRAQRRQRRK